MELGAAITVEGMQYALSGKVGYRPPVPAYTTLVQELIEQRWITDWNSIRQHIVR